MEYEVTISPRMGPGPQDAKQGRALNRIITWGQDGIEYEADPRQAERLVYECGMHGAKPMGTPGAKVSFKEYEDDAADSYYIGDDDDWWCVWCDSQYCQCQDE